MFGTKCSEFGAHLRIREVLWPLGGGRRTFSLIRVENLWELYKFDIKFLSANPQATGKGK